MYTMYFLLHQYIFFFTNKGTTVTTDATLQNNDRRVLTTDANTLMVGVQGSTLRF